MEICDIGNFPNICDVTEQNSPLVLYTEYQYVESLPTSRISIGDAYTDQANLLKKHNLLTDYLISLQLEPLSFPNFLHTLNAEMSGFLSALKNQHKLIAVRLCGTWFHMTNKNIVICCQESYNFLTGENRESHLCL